MVRNGRLQKRLAPLLAVIVTLVLGTGLALAAALSQSYTSTSQLVPGMLVSLDKSTNDAVQPANTSNVDDLMGVVVGSSDSLISVGATGANQYQVATQGEVSTLVTDLNGDIKTGDRITVSPISGVGMKATESVKVVGIAQADFSASSQGAATTDVKDKSGKTTTVHYGQIPVLISASYFSVGSGDTSSLIPKPIQDLANALAGKSVSPVRIIISAILLILVVILISVFVYGSVQSSIISIGRNPLSSGAVRKSMIQVMVISLAVLAVTIGAIYLIISR